MIFKEKIKKGSILTQKRYASLTCKESTYRYQRLMMIMEASTVFLGFFFADFLKVFCKRNFQALLVVFIESIVLKSVKGNCRLQNVLEVHKAKEVLSSTHCGFFDQTDTLESWKRAKYVQIERGLRLTSLSEASLGMPSTQRLFVASWGM